MRIWFNKYSQYRYLYHESPKMIILQLSLKSMPLYPRNPFARPLKRGRKMMQLYGAGFVRDRSLSNDGGEIARYLNWEYGEGTGLGVLNGWTAQRRSPPRKGRFGFVDRFARLPAAIGARVAARQIDGWGSELALLAQWKRGGLSPLELGNRLEAMQRRTGIQAPESEPVIPQAGRGELI